MKRATLIVFAIILGVSVASLHATDMRSRFEDFKRVNGKSYTSAQEEELRFKVFSDNMAEAELLNKRNPQARFGASPFADMTAAEFKVYHKADQHYSQRVAEMRSTKDTTQYYPRPSEDQLKATPTDIDWRAKGAVTAVKNQGQCGSCWAFSTTGGIEGQWKLAGHDLVSLSEQELVACDTTDSGCNGGLMATAMDWLLANKQGSIVTEASYPYTSGGGTSPACIPNKGTVGATIKGHYYIYHDESIMKAWVGANGPLSLAVDASAWQLYMGGIMTDCGGSSLDHGVLIVGYTFTGQTTPYWIFKNSWASSWGEQGYIYIAYGSNQCLLTHYPVTSLVTGSVPAPTPLPTTAYFVHSVFDDQNCTTGGQKFVWQQNKCVSWDGVSFTASCSNNQLSITAYYNSLTCTGQSQASTEPLNSCQEADTDFMYYSNKCVSGSEALEHVGHNSRKAASHMVKHLKKSQKK